MLLALIPSLVFLGLGVLVGRWWILLLPPAAWVSYYFWDLRGLEGGFTQTFVLGIPMGIVAAAGGLMIRRSMRSRKYPADTRGG